ncbi:tRNA pseudouridine synthase A [Bartonella bacilliformis str. Heidi Mejia]|uniref:tRNA pseudouridine synthase A n=2 Tax=Bartonella bacilliformis TaxID=774 RepID=TRUA_BARBK|nr:tRNA pseudouridine(38-40) synthase TruA [Bartonella bacilliformis]A1UUB6.1 RecName: Full=tRNA pseudouridine synthase A; AltName: Full=tRNA pseudouridine(38-40) synthase; AltName: Full=tRNA pseudouridylate synthase I; AltName: Full=tRNA-uridine isomerase I [Bartonella bacilliformis KC583]ABM45005.1 tRNA pseudouridine synthase A [Bartonella bacilliformis KC583]AMG86286.1 tRNA pseudouridine(38-40) synthase TruA [Bartonella bacilliformis]EKS43200.1 tRNA pseudouridine synthase A [Bartonella bacil
MARFKLTLEYDGSNYAGWQRQAELRTVQGAVEQAIFHFSGQQLTITTAGRTDAGVHATGQVAHVDFEKDWHVNTIHNALNAHLRQQGDNIAILNVENIPDSFDARLSAVKRHYLFKILNRRAPPALNAKRVWWLPRPLNADAMHKAAQKLVGKHDFTTFRSAHCQAKSPIRTLECLDVQREGEEIFLYARARSFLHHQIRSFAGSLMEVGIGRWTAQDLEEALHAKDRARCGMVAPPSGLYLTQVDY